ncbi:MAG: phage tail tube protein [Lachnospirales bacterium]
MANVIMNAKDSLNAKLAECYVTINNNRYNFMQAINLEATVEKNKVQVPILGRTAKGNKSSGWVGKGKAKFHYNTSVFRRLLRDYKNTGEDIYFDIQVTNEDPTSEAGRQSVILIDCNLDGGVLAKFDAEGSFLEEEMSFTFEDFKLVEEFSSLNGML